MLASLSRLARPAAAAAVGAAAAAAAYASGGSAHCHGAGRSNPQGLSKLRRQSFPLADHYHGKARVRVLRVH